MKRLKRNFLFLWGFFLLPFLAQSQEKLQHESQSYVSPEGKLFWPERMPVFIRISSTPEDPGVLMRSESTAQYADPYFFDTEGVNYIRTRHAVNKETGKMVYPLTDVVWEVYRDGTPPSTNAVYKGSKHLEKGKIHALPGLQTVLSASDAMSGVKSTLYSIDGAPYAIYDSALIFTVQKEFVLKYYAVDNVGNACDEKEIVILIDGAPPSSLHSFTGETKDEAVSGKAELHITAEDDATGVQAIYYQLDGGPETLYRNPLKLAGLPEGEHTVVYYSMDELEQKEEEKKVRFFIDNTPPIITSDLLGDSFFSAGNEYSSGRTRVKLTAIDNKAGVKSIHYAINGGEPQEYDSPFFLSGAQGNQTISYYAVDYVGNKSSSAVGKESIATPYLDLSGPKLDYQLLGPSFAHRDTIFISDQTKIDLRASDPESGMQKIVFRINQGGESTFNEPFTLDEEGVYQIAYYGFDNVNNSSKNAFYVVVDKQAPKIIPVFSERANGEKTIANEQIEAYSSYAILFLAATDTLVGCEKLFYSINGGKEYEYTNPVKGFEKGNVYQIMVSASDKVGNKNTNELKFYIED